MSYQASAENEGTLRLDCPSNEKALLCWLPVSGFTSGVWPFDIKYWVYVDVSLLR